MKSTFVKGLSFATILFLLTPCFGSAGKIVEFRIPAGTGGKSWNSPDNPVVVNVGDTLRIFNDDSVAHFLHTNGKPCGHGSGPFAQGKYYDCVVAYAYDQADQDLYDHNYGPEAQFYVQANP